MYKDVAKNLKQFSIKLPNTIVPSPTIDDYDSGYIMRYFIQKANDENSHIFEINQKEYERYKENVFWIIGELKWRIRGPLNTTYKMNGDIDDVGVINANKASIARISQTLKNVGLYLPNLSQFYK